MGPRASLSLSLTIAALSIGLSCTREAVGPAGPVVPSASSAPRLPARPAGCRTVAAGGALQPQLDAVPEGTAVCLAPGVHAGPVRIARRLVVWGPRAAVVRSRGVGTTVMIEAPGTHLLGLTVDGSGNRFDQDDAAVKVRADDVRVEGVHVVNAVFGILVERANRVVVARNEVEGDRREATGMRGDGIRLWETRHSRVEENRVTWGRDCVLWYSSDNVFARNVIEHGRYGAHLMYSHRNRVEDNRFAHDVVGTFLMYSREVVVAGNEYRDMFSNAGMGLGIKECGNVVVRDNRFLRCRTGIYIDTSPLSIGEKDELERNELYLADAAIVFHGRSEGNTFQDNVFRGNREQVATEGGGDALASRWSLNSFDDYQGYDLDGDGIGDVAYEQRSLSSQLTSERAAIAFFRGTPAMAVVDALGKLVPLFAPRTMMRDERPRVGAPERAVMP